MSAGRISDVLLDAVRALIGSSDALVVEINTMRQERKQWAALIERLNTENAAAYHELDRYLAAYGPAPEPEGAAPDLRMAHRGNHHE